MSLRVLGLITARGGSKGIPGKNIKLLAGKPLLGYTAEAARDSRITRTILSTDDEAIARVAREFGIDVPFMRPKELALDHSKSIDVVQHAIKWLKENAAEEYDYVMILQPTSPCRTSDDINAVIAIAEETGADSVMSEVEMPNFSPQKTHKIIDGKIHPYFEEAAEGGTPSRRQDLAKAYRRNAAIYLTKTNLLLAGDMFGRDSRAYIMPEERSVDIDNPIDFELAEFWVNRTSRS